jgi:hypothetical protein
MKTTILVVLGLLSAVAVTVHGPAAAADSTGCDRECLRGTMTTFLYALVKHDAKQSTLCRQGPGDRGPH